MPPSDPYPKDGLAVSSDLELLPIESVDPSTSDAKSLAETMKAEFDKAEQQDARRDPRARGLDASRERVDAAAASRHGRGLVSRADGRTGMDGLIHRGRALVSRRSG